MIPNHAQFIAAIGQKNLVTLVFYSVADAATVERECAPLDYGPDPANAETLNRYWVWDPAATAGPNPLGLLPVQIVSLTVLGRGFDPRAYPLTGYSWSVPRDWELTAPGPLPPAPPPEE